MVIGVVRRVVWLVDPGVEANGVVSGVVGVDGVELGVEERGDVELGVESEDER